MTSIVGIDMSLTSTGLARVTYGAGQWVTETHSRTSKGKLKDTITMRHARIRGIASDVHEWASGAALAVIEGPSFGSRGGSPVDRYGLWWRVVGRLVDAEIPVVVCPPQTRAKFASGRGNDDKAAVAVAVSKMWPDAEIANSDEADALALGSAGACLLGLPVPFPVTKYRTDSLGAMQVPDGLPWAGEERAA